MCGASGAAVVPRPPLVRLADRACELAERDISIRAAQTARLSQRSQRAKQKALTQVFVFVQILSAQSYFCLAASGNIRLRILGDPVKEFERESRSSIVDDGVKATCSKPMRRR